MVLFRRDWFYVIKRSDNSYWPVDHSVEELFFSQLLYLRESTAKENMDFAVTPITLGVYKGECLVYSNKEAKLSNQAYKYLCDLTIKAKKVVYFKVSDIIGYQISL